MVLVTALMLVMKMADSSSDSGSDSGGKLVPDIERIILLS